MHSTGICYLKHITLLKQAYIHTHTHTYIYIYIYNIWRIFISTLSLQHFTFSVIFQPRIQDVWTRGVRDSGFNLSCKSLYMIQPYNRLCNFLLLHLLFFFLPSSSEHTLWHISYLFSNVTSSNNSLFCWYILPPWILFCSVQFMLRNLQKN